MSFSGSLIQNAIYIAQQPPEWPIAAADWERAAEDAARSRCVRVHRGWRRGRVDHGREPRCIRAVAHSPTDADRRTRRATSPSTCSASIRLRRSCSRRSVCSRSRTPKASLAAARAAASSGVPIVLSSAATHSIEDVAATGAPRWFQLYWVNDREICESFVHRAEAAGYGAIVVTLDTLTLGWRPRDLRQAYLPFIKGEGCGQFFSDPVFRSRLDKPPEEDLLTAAATMLATFPEPRPLLGRPRLAARADEAADPRQGRAHRGRCTRGSRSRRRRHRRLESRWAAGGRRGRRARRARRSARSAAQGSAS